MPSPCVLTFSELRIIMTTCVWACTYEIGVIIMICTLHFYILTFSEEGIWRHIVNSLSGIEKPIFYTFYDSVKWWTGIFRAQSEDRAKKKKPITTQEAPQRYNDHITTQIKITGCWKIDNFAIFKNSMTKRAKNVGWCKSSVVPDLWFVTHISDLVLCSKTIWCIVGCVIFFFCHSLKNGNKRGWDVRSHGVVSSPYRITVTATYISSAKGMAKWSILPDRRFRT